MRRIVVITLAIVLCVVRFGIGKDQPSKAANTKADPKAAEKKNQTPKSKKDGEASAADKEKHARPDAAETRSADDEAIHHSADAYVTAFSKADAKSIADLFTEDAEYVDVQSEVIQGRTAIEESLKEFFKENPDCTMELDIESIRYIGPGLAVEDGTTSIVFSEKGADPEVTRYTAVHIKTKGKWHIASIRDFPASPQSQHRIRIKALEWMLGEWVHEGDDATVFFSCKLDRSENYLLREFKVHLAGQEMLSGTQRIGWDAHAGKLRAWIFDSDGGHSEGYFHRDGDKWLLKASGETAEGRSASSTSIFTIVDAQSMTFQSIDNEVAGVESPDSEPVKIVRRPPRPK